MSRSRPGQLRGYGSRHASFGASAAAIQGRAQGSLLVGNCIFRRDFSIFDISLLISSSAVMLGANV